MLIAISSGSLVTAKMFGHLCLSDDRYVYLGGASETSRYGQQTAFTVFSNSQFVAGSLTRPVAYLTLVNPEQTVAGVLNLQVVSKGLGTGSKIVRSLRSHYAQLDVHEIRATAVSFWKRLGAVQRDGSALPDKYTGDAVLR